jgi:hypothetical protein
VSHKNLRPETSALTISFYGGFDRRANFHQSALSPAITPAYTLVAWSRGSEFIWAAGCPKQ